MSDDANNDTGKKLDVIVGAAVRALVEAGADDAMVGAFAAAHRVKVAGVLGVGPGAPPEPPDIEAVVKRALAEVLEQTPAPRASAGARLTRAVNVIVGGRRTSVTLPKDLHKKLVSAKGEKAATSLVQRLANEAPSDTGKRSAWVAENVLRHLALEDAVPDSPARH